MPWGVAAAAVGALGSIGGGLIGSSTAGKAASAQQSALSSALDWVRNVYGSAQGQFQPYIGTGVNALNALNTFYGLPGGGENTTQAYNAFTQTPFYQFPLQQANLQTNRALAASGLTNSGGALRDLSQLNAGYASQGLGQYLSGLGTLANAGQNAIGTLGGIGSQTSQPISQLGAGLGNAAAQGIYNSTSSIMSGLNNALPYLTGNLGQSSYGSGGLLGSLAGLFGGSSNPGSVGGGVPTYAQSQLLGGTGQY